jgi:uncharacterized membrane protein YjdF
MGRLGDVLQSDGGAVLAWAVAVTPLVTVPVFLAAGEPDWAVVALFVTGAALVPPAVTGRATVTFPPELLGLVTAPVLVRATGAAPQATPFLATAGVALLLTVAAESYTSLSVTPRFAVVLVTVATMAGAGIWTVGIWVADAVAGTALLGGKTELMWDLTTATAAGVGAGVVFEGYLTVTDRLDRLRRPADPAASADSGPAAEPEPTGPSGWGRLAVRGMQAVLLGIVGVALLRRDPTLVVNSVLPLGITVLPALLRHEYDYPTDPLLVLWVTVAATVHAVGALGPYQTVPVYDSVAHVVSGGLVASVGYVLARAVELYTEDVSFQPAFRGVFVLLFVLAVGVAWELFEFASTAFTVVAGEPLLAQFSADDIAKDILADGVGGGLVVLALWSEERFRALAGAVSDAVGVLVRRG